MRLLLDKGADVNAKGEKYGSALQAASYCGHEVMMRLLLEKGANVNAKGGKYGSALQAASDGGMRRQCDCFSHLKILYDLLSLSYKESIGPVDILWCFLCASAARSDAGPPKSFVDISRPSSILDIGRPYAVILNGVLTPEECKQLLDAAQARTGGK